MFVVLSIGFMIVSGAVCGLLLSASLSNYRDAVRNELATVAEVVALQVDAELHEQLRDRAQESTALYRAQIERLDRALQRTSGIRYIYTLRKESDGFRFVLDPTPEGDRDGDGVNDKSHLMEPYPEIAPYAILAFRTGTVQVDSEPNRDRWGTFLSAYAPVKDSSGRVVAVLGVDRDYSLIQAHELGIKRQALGACLLAAFLSLFVASLLSSRLARRSTGLVRSRLVAGLVRSTLFEIALYSVVATLTVGGIVSYYQAGSDLESIRDTADTEQRLLTLKADLDSLHHSNGYSAARLDRIRREAADLGQSWLVNDIDRERARAERGEADWNGLHNSASIGLIGAIRNAVVGRAEAVERIGERSDSLISLFAVATILSLASLVFIRAAARQDQDLKHLHDEHAEQRAAHGHLVESLPIGLYAYRDGKCVYANSAWDNLTDRRVEEAREAALVRALHPEDEKRVEATLRRAEETQEPFVVQCRIGDWGQENRYLELHGVPVRGTDGTFLHVLAFCLDITRTVNARKQLNEKNKEIRNKNRLLSRALEDLEANLMAMVHALVKAVEAKDQYTAGHSARVMAYSVRLARELGLDDRELKILEMGTLIHDVGKIGVPDDILNKPSELTNEEYDLIKSHPDLGYRMIEGIPMFQECAPIVRWHHERQDGTGYPDGLAGDQIPLIVQIAAIADTFDAMTSTRAYREGLSYEIALAELRREALMGRFDSGLIELLARIVDREGLLHETSLPRAA